MERGKMKRVTLQEKPNQQTLLQPGNHGQHQQSQIIKTVCTPDMMG